MTKIERKKKLWNRVLVSAIVSNERLCDKRWLAIYEQRIFYFTEATVCYQVGSVPSYPTLP